MDENENANHHIRQNYCRNRLEYRRGRRLRAVKVYTVANESKHLLVFGVPKINLKQEIKCKLKRCGDIEFIQCVTEEIAKKVELEAFTDVYHVTYTKVQAARRAKRYLDAQEFYGGILHISYAPEYETTEELRQKLLQRKVEINYRQKVNEKVAKTMSTEAQLNEPPDKISKES
ncbi:RNA-binding protein 48 [Zeugodacus cucurbitae]|uniref:RNA-binding protein 48 n=1 Tax=Zeugodacus cucurbitae TaxID=28588 RepID=UPI0023D9332C|nr:RNA-binding protein 48 [Zeugodacus cucurbitae]